MKRVLFSGILATLLAACGPMTAAEPISGSGELVTRAFDLDGFTKIEAENSAQVEMTHEDTYSVQVEVDSNLVDHLNVQVRRDTLHIGMDGGSYTDVTLRARVTMPRLTGVTLRNASIFRGQVAGEDLTLDINNASVVQMLGIAGDVDIEASGASVIDVSADGDVQGTARGASLVTVGGSPTSVEVETEDVSVVDTR